MGTISRHIKWKFLVIAVAAAITAGGLLLSTANTTQVQAEEGCTKSGEAKYVGPILTCDCTSATISTCSCVIQCPPSGD